MYPWFSFWLLLSKVCNPWNQTENNIQKRKSDAGYFNISSEASTFINSEAYAPAAFTTLLTCTVTISDDEVETVADYEGQLSRMKERGPLPVNI